VGFSAQQDAAAGFFEEEVDDHDKGCGDDGVRVEDPAPGRVADDHA
jgi:hypothetical protein